MIYEKFRFYTGEIFFIPLTHIPWDEMNNASIKQ